MTRKNSGSTSFWFCNHLNIFDFLKCKNINNGINVDSKNLCLRGFFCTKNYFIKPFLMQCWFVSNVRLMKTQGYIYVVLHKVMNVFSYKGINIRFVVSKLSTKRHFLELGFPCISGMKPKGGSNEMYLEWNCCLNSKKKKMMCGWSCLTLGWTVDAV